MKILSWASTPNLETSIEKCKLLVESAKLYNVDLDMMGVGYNYRYLKDKLFILEQHIQELDDETLITCIDGFDTLINSKLENLDNIFNEFNTKVVISSERIFSYQWHNYQDKFEKIESPYRYVNSGTITGRVKDIKNMLKEIYTYREMDMTDIDQGLVGIWVYKNMDNPSVVKLDTEGKITWVVCGEWNKLKKISEKTHIINHPIYHHIPPIIHVPGSQDEFHYTCYEEALNNIKRRFLL
jgi:hypothetical protein